MTELVDQLKSNPSGIRDVRLLSSHKDEHPSSDTPSHDTSPHEALQVAPHSRHLAPDIKKQRAEYICGPDVAITAETSVDSSGRAHAKLTMRTDNEREKPKETLLCQRVKKKGKEEVFVCRRRNGLDPTPAELRGERKFEYLPLKSNIPEYNTSKSGKCGKPIVLSDHMSNGSAHLGSKFRRNTDVYPGGMMKKNCPANIPEERLNKYDTCINRRNGLQDKCDAVSKNALKSCRKSK